MRVTLKDIAQATGTSVPTVSLILNNKPFRVSEQTREKVLQAAHDMHYVTNQAARDLRQGTSSIIGLIVPDISNDFYGTFAKGVEREAREIGWSVMLNTSDNETSREAQYIDLIHRQGSAGIILANAAGKQEEVMHNMQMLVERHIPHVLLDFSGSSKSDVVTGDHLHGGYEATQYLIRLGHRRIACVTGPLYLQGAKSRFSGYQQALKEHHITLDQRFVREGDYTYETAVDIARGLPWGDFTAVFACNDLMAMAVCTVAGELGYNIPRDCSVIGYDDVFFAGIMNPALTTMHQPLAEMGKEAVELLIHRIEYPHAKRATRVHKLQLMVRSSTAPCR